MKHISVGASTPANENRLCPLVRRCALSSLFLGFCLWAGTAVADTNCVTPPSGLIGWWPGNGDAKDIGGGNHGTLHNGAGFAAGLVGQAFAFTGSNQFVQIPNAPVLNPTNGLTLEAWVLVSHYPNNDGVLVVGKDWLWAQRQYLIALNAAGNRWSFRPHVGVPSGTAYFDGTVSIQTNAWYHVAMTYDNSHLRLYVNGTLDGSLPVAGPSVTTTNPLLIGGFGQGPWTLTGRVDEVGLYNRALTASEVQAIYHAGSAGKCAAPMPPVILTQPSSQTVTQGAKVTFSVTAAGAPPLKYQWRFNDNNLPGATNSVLTLTNVQPAQAGKYWVLVSNVVGGVASSIAILTVHPVEQCVPPPAGLVAWWPGNGNANDIIGGHNGVLSNGTTFATGKVGQAFKFDGRSNLVRVSASAALNVGKGSGLTIETWVNPFQRAQGQPIAEWYRSTSGNLPGGVQFWVSTGSDMMGLFGAYLTDTSNVLHVISSPPGMVASNVFQHVAVTYDKESGIARLFFNGVAVNEVKLGTFTPQTSNDFYIGRRPSGQAGEGAFAGLIDELSLYGRALTSTEILAIYRAGSAGKCSSGNPPSILTQPAHQTVTAGAPATFTVTAAGTPPLSYQWRFNGTNLTRATNATLTLTNVQLSQAGNYSVRVTNAFGAITSSNALLTVSFPAAIVRVVSTSALAGASVSVPVVLVANGNENALGFSLDFNPALLRFTGVALGSGASGASLFSNTNLASTGRLGLLVGLESNLAFRAGTQEVVRLSFVTVAVTNTTSASLNFSDQPTARQLADARANVLPATYAGGTVSLAVSVEGDVSPRPNGDKAVTVRDWVQVGRYVSHLDTLTNGSEFQRADCAPRSTLGDGRLTTADWVQVGRYAMGLDPLTPAGGPLGPGAGMALRAMKQDTSGGSSPSQCAVRVPDATFTPGETGTISVELKAQGAENALGFSLTFDPAVFSFVGATLGSGANGAALHVNSDLSGAGRLGCLLALPPGSSFAAGAKEVIKVSLRATPSAAGRHAVTFTDEPVPREVSDATAQAVTANYVNGSISLRPTVPSLSIARLGGNLVLSWPAWATNFILQTAENIKPLPVWTDAAVTPVTIDNENTVTLPVSGQTRFYRLSQP